MGLCVCLLPDHNYSAFWSLLPSPQDYFLAMHTCMNKQKTLNKTQRLLCYNMHTNSNQMSIASSRQFTLHYIIIGPLFWILECNTDVYLNSSNYTPGPHCYIIVHRRVHIQNLEIQNLLRTEIILDFDLLCLLWSHWQFLFCFLGFLRFVAMSELSNNLANSVYPGIDSDNLTTVGVTHVLITTSQLPIDMWPCMRQVGVAISKQNYRLRHSLSAKQ